MTRNRRHIKTLLENREALLEKQYYKQEVSKAADEFNEKLVAKLLKRGIKIKVSK